MFGRGRKREMMEHRRLVLALSVAMRCRGCECNVNWFHGTCVSLLSAVQLVPWNMCVIVVSSANENRKERVCSCSVQLLQLMRRNILRSWTSLSELDCDGGETELCSVETKGCLRWVVVG